MLTQKPVEKRENKEERRRGEREENPQSPHLTMLACPVGHAAEAGWGLELCLAMARAKSQGCSISVGSYLEEAVPLSIHRQALSTTDTGLTGPGAVHGHGKAQAVASGSTEATFSCARSLS